MTVTVCASSHSKDSQSQNRSNAAVSMVSAFLVASVLNASSPALATESFLKRTGARGLLMEEEEQLLLLATLTSPLEERRPLPQLLKPPLLPLES